MDAQESERPAKRLRISENADNVPESESNEENEELLKEIRSGITAYVNPQTPTFSGILKQRYTDFIVNEISPDGEVLHLRSLKAVARSARGQEPDANGHDRPTTDTPDVTGEARATDTPAAPEEPTEVTPEDRDAVALLLGEASVQPILDLYKAIVQNPNRRPRDFAPILSAPVLDRQVRTDTHQTIRRIFHSRLETQTQDDNTIKITAAPRKPSGISQGRNPVAGKLGWDELGGEYVHFTLLKENKDTMESIGFLATQTKVPTKRFQFPGTKDRRAVTVQRACVYRIHADHLEGIGRRLKSAKIGDFSYQPQGLQLGQLGGNEFCISLRDCHFPGEEGLDMDTKLALAEKTLARTAPAFERDGFINYYGLQRFGAFSTSTDGIGMKMLQGDLKGAVDDILHFSPDALATAQADGPQILVSSDDRARATALHLWSTTKDSQKALPQLPRKFSAESNIIRCLGSKNKSKAHDYQGALSSIPRNLRLMYVHAYQSRVWNVVAGERWRLHGAQVVEGDLVVADAASKAGQAEAEVDEAGEPIVQPAAEDSAAAPEDEYTRARPLSKEEAESGRYTVFDVVLPLPGFDVVYPPNAVGKFYESFMGSAAGGGLDPHNMRRSWKDISLSGGYRSLVARPLSPMSYTVKTYTHDTEQLAETDLDLFEKPAAADGNGNGNAHDQPAPSEAKIAVILRFQLGRSQYATMALRELLGAGGVRTYRPDFGGGRTN